MAVISQYDPGWRLSYGIPRRGHRRTCLVSRSIGGGIGGQFLAIPEEAKPDALCGPRLEIRQDVDIAVQSRASL